MRRLCSVTVLALLLMMSVFGQVNASVRPSSDNPNRGSDTDDHPWGGDQGNGGNGVIITPIDRPVVTGFFAIDLFFNRVVVHQMHVCTSAKRPVVTPNSGTATPSTSTQTRGTSGN